jgi:hypothetical protein
MTNAFGGGELTVVGFAVAWAPIVTLDRSEPDAEGTSRFFVPVYTDADVADLYQRVTGERLPEFEGTLSDGYRKALGL